MTNFGDSSTSPPADDAELGEVPPAAASDPEEPLEYLRRAGHEAIDDGVSDRDETQHSRLGDWSSNDEHGRLLAVGHTAEHSEEDYWRQEKLAKLEADNERAQHLAPTLVGLTVAEAQRIVDQHASLSVRFHQQGRPYPLVGTFGGISAWVFDGVVVNAD